MESTRSKPRKAFSANMEDAHHLVRMVDGFTNRRVRRMRREFRDKVGAAMRVPAKDCDQLDCLESDDVLVVFKPGSALGRDHFTDNRPLLRQALVAACAATETYLADISMTRMSTLTKSEQAATPRVRKIPMTVGDWLHLEHRYKRRRRGLHEQVIRKHIAELASTDPSKVGQLLSLLGIERWADKLDEQRGVGKGDTLTFLKRVTDRRNRIVHTGDRQGTGRASLSVDEVRLDLAAFESIVDAVEHILR